MSSLYHVDLHGASAPRARESRYLPAVLTHQELLRLIDFLRGTCQLMTDLLYGCGLRLKECPRPHVPNIGKLQIFASEGDKDRITLLP